MTTSKEESIKEKINSFWRKIRRLDMISYFDTEIEKILIRLEKIECHIENREHTLTLLFDQIMETNNLFMELNNSEVDSRVQSDLHLKYILRLMLEDLDNATFRGQGMKVLRNSKALLELLEG